MNSRTNDPHQSPRPLWVFGLLVFLLPIGWAALKEVRFDPHVANNLSDLTSQQKFQRWFKSYFHEEQPLVATWEESKLDDPRITILTEKLLGKIDADGERRGGSPYVASVSGPVDILRVMTAKGVSLPDALERLKGVVISRGDLRIQLTEAGRKDKARSIREISAAAEQEFGRKFTQHDPIVVAQADREEEEASAGTETPTSKSVEDQTVAHGGGTVGTFEVPILPHDFRLSWEQMQSDSETDQAIVDFVAELRGFATTAEPDGQRLVADCGFLLGSPIALRIHLSDAGRTNVAAAERDIREAARVAGISPDRFDLGGSLLAVQEEVRQLSSTFWNSAAPGWLPQDVSISLFAVFVSILVLWRVARDWRFTMTAAALTVLAAVACPITVSLIGQPFHSLCLAVPGLTATLVLSGLVHQRRADVLRGSLESEICAGLRRPFYLAVAILCMGMVPLALSRVISMRWFALYCVIGCGVAWLLVMEVYPAIHRFWKRTAPVAFDPGWAEWTRWTTRNRRAIYGWSACVVLLGMTGFIRLTWQTIIPAELPAESLITKEHQAIEERLEGLTPMEIVVRFTKETQDRLRFIKRMEVIREIKDAVCELPQVSGGLCLADFHIVEELPPEDANKRELVQFNRHSNEVEREWKRPENDVSRQYLAVATTAADWRTPGDQRLCKPQDELWRITVQTRSAPASTTEVIDQIEQRVQSVTRFYSGADHIVAGMSVLEARGKTLITESLFWGLSAMTLAVLVVVSFQIQNLWGGMLAGGATLWPVAAAVGGLVAYGGFADAVLLSATIPSLAMTLLGMSRWVDEYRRCAQSNSDPATALEQTVALCSWPQLQLAAIVVSAGLVLSMSDWPIVSRFGWQSAIIGASTVITAGFWIPALLSGQLGKMILLGVTVEASASPEAASEASLFEESALSVTDEDSKIELPAATDREFQQTMLLKLRAVSDESPTTERPKVDSPRTGVPAPHHLSMVDRPAMPKRTGG